MFKNWIPVTVFSNLALFLDLGTTLYHILDDKLVIISDHKSSTYTS